MKFLRKSFALPLLLVVVIAISLTLASVVQPQRSVEGHKLSLTLNGWSPPSAGLPSGASMNSMTVADPASAFLSRRLAAWGDTEGSRLRRSVADMDHLLASGQSAVANCAPERRNWRLCRTLSA